MVIPIILLTMNLCVGIINLVLTIQKNKGEVKTLEIPNMDKNILAEWLFGPAAKEK